MKRKNNVITEDNHKDAIAHVVEVIEDVVGSTIGAGGKLILATNPIYGKPTLSKDGIHALANIKFYQTRHSMLHTIFEEGINKTAAQSGDGRTTSTIIACQLIRQGIKEIGNISIQDIDNLVDKAIEHVKSEAKQVNLVDRTAIKEKYLDLGKNFDLPEGEEDDPLVDMNKNLIDIAMVSSNGDEEISTAISTSMERVGMTGLVTANITSSNDVGIEYSNGLIFHSGLVSEYFVDDKETMSTTYKNPLYLISAGKLSDPKSIARLVREAAGASRPLVVMAEGYHPKFVEFAIITKIEQGVDIVLVDPYKYGERRLFWLQDMAVSLNATLFDGIQHKTQRGTIKDLGSSGSVKIKLNNTTITEPHSDPERLESYKAQLQAKAAQEASQFNKEKILERVANLTGDLALIKVGAASETLALERLARCEDALNSCLQASQHGYVDGGGAALYRAGIKWPLLRILDNAGIVEGDERWDSIMKLVEEETCYDVLTGAASDNIIDSVITIVNGLENARAIAKAIISASHILDLPEIDDERGF